MNRTNVLTCALLLAACSGEVDDNPFATGSGGATAGGTDSTGMPTGITGSDYDSDSGTTGATGASSTGGDGGGTGLKFDTPDGTATGTATGGDGQTGCEKIDFLFIIDNSGSMSPHQQNLIDNFGPFMDTIAAEVQGTDYHVMALDTDSCPAMGAACTPSSCEDTLGAGQVRSCPVPSDTRYLDSSMSLADIKAGFTCAANVGDQGSGEEMPMSAMMAAIGAESEAGGCNPGFVRDDAILVVTFITDDHTGWFGDDDVNNVGSPEEWYDAVVAAKGNPANVVVLGLVALLSDQSCIGFGPKEADRFVEFVDMWGDHGLTGSVCDSDYNGFFQQAVGLIDTTCDDYVPEG